MECDISTQLQLTANKNKYFLLIDNAGDSKHFYYMIIDFFQNQNIKYIEIDDIDKLYNIQDKWCDISGIILSGGGRLLSNSNDHCIYDISKNIAPINLLRVPILGICYGFQILNLFYGGKISSLQEPNNNIMNIRKITPYHKLLKGVGTNNSFNTVCYNNDVITNLSPVFNLLCKGQDPNVNMGFYNDDMKIYGVQFHPEALEETRNIILNFINIIC